MSAFSFSSPGGLPPVTGSRFIAAMKTFLAILLAACAVCAAPADSDKPATSPAAAVKNVSPKDAEALIKDQPGVLILDIRTPDEFAKGHIPGAKNVDFFSDDFEKQVAALDSSKPVLVHCASGNRSSQAVEKIAALRKFKGIYHLKAGFSGWKSAKKPVEN